MSDRRYAPKNLARLLTNLLNPFFLFTALYALVAFTQSSVPRAFLYLDLELLAAGVVAGFVFYLARRRRVGGFWLPERAGRLLPAGVLLAVFVVLLISLALLDAPVVLFAVTLSMGLAAAMLAGVTRFWKASAHAAVAGHAAIAGLLVLGAVGLLFVVALPLVIWSRVVLGAHTLPQTLVGAAVGAAFALLFLA